MKKLFVSKIDNKSFTNKEDLIDYLIDNYIIEDQEGGDISLIHQKLQESFPFADISIKEADGKYNRNYGEYIVDMNWEEYNGDFTFYVGEHDDYDYYHSSYKKIEDAITYYKNYLEKKDEIILKLNKVYSPELITINQMYESDDDRSISFYITVKGKEYFGSYEFGDTDMFVNSFRGYFDNVIEGEVIREYNHAGGYDYDPTISGVPLKNIIQRAKKLRIEILKEND